MEIRAATSDDLEEILTLLNSVSLDLREKGINQWEYPWDKGKLEAQMETLHVVSVDGAVIGTFGIRDVYHIGEFKVNVGSKYLFQIAIHPEYQGKGFGSVIASWVLENAKDPLYLDCWAGNEKLKSFYLENGFEYVGDFPEEDYYISVFKGNPGGTREIAI